MKTLYRIVEEYKQQLDNAGKENVEQLTAIITSLEKQKELLDAQLHTYRHSGFAEKDIFETYKIYPNTTFTAKIILADPKQEFTIYYRVVTKDNEKIWFGFGGREKNSIGSNPSEYTIIKHYGSIEVVLQENIQNHFKNCYPHRKEPVYIDCVRLRADDKDLREVIFNYKIG